MNKFFKKIALTLSIVVIATITHASSAFAASSTNSVTVDLPVIFNITGTNSYQSKSAVLDLTSRTDIPNNAVVTGFYISAINKSGNWGNMVYAAQATEGSYMCRFPQRCCSAGRWYESNLGTTYIPGLSNCNLKVKQVWYLNFYVEQIFARPASTGLQAQIYYKTN